jgi:hypothetical protein
MKLRIWARRWACSGDGLSISCCPTLLLIPPLSWLASGTRVRRQRADWKFRARYEPASRSSAFGQTGDAETPRQDRDSSGRLGICFERLRRVSSLLRAKRWNVGSASGPAHKADSAGCEASTPREGREFRSLSRVPQFESQSGVRRDKPACCRG